MPEHFWNTFLIEKEVPDLRIIPTLSTTFNENILLLRSFTDRMIECPFAKGNQLQEIFVQLEPRIINAFEHL